MASLALDSRAVAPGALFFALSGARDDGLAHLDEAFARGAVCAVCEKPPPEAALPHVLVPDAHKALALCAALWYASPAEKLTLIAVTGTNGKTTTSELIRQMLARTIGATVGLIGTNRILIGDAVLPAARTTPDALTLQRLLAQMVDAGCTHAVMEVSSHALVQRRVYGIPFALGVFTNLTRDHLDYHGTMEAYCDAKALLFDACARAVVNGDDPWAPRILSRFTGARTTFGQNLTNDLVAWRPRYENDRVCFAACTDLDHEETAVAIPGGFSLYNALAALGAVCALGVPLRDAARALPLCRGVKGRCEIVPLPGAPFTVLIDYAHTPDGLKSILTTVCSFAQGRVIALFGCGGERDRGKRAPMGRVAATLADFVVLTSDNPRGEDPYAILRQILPGVLARAAPFAVIEDRRAAIAFALGIARPGDVLVLCGKGHETTQQIGNTAFPLDEREVVRETFAQLQRKDAAPAAKEHHHEDHHCSASQLCPLGGHRQASDP